MSSETWIEPSARQRRSPADDRKAPAESSDALQPWQLFTLAGLIGATVVVFVSRGHTVAGIILLSLMIFAAAIVGIAAWRTFGPLVMPDDTGGTQVLGGRTRAALEREKALVLRSIKELEFDRAMGKVAEKDFLEMSARLRARAAGLIRQLDAGSSYRDAITKEVDRRLRWPDKSRVTGTSRVEPGTSSTLRAQPPQADDAPAGGNLPTQRGVEGPGPAEEMKPAGALTASTAPAVTCPHCGTENDSDAQFCKRCGASLETSE